MSSHSLFHAATLKFLPAPDDLGLEGFALNRGPAQLSLFDGTESAHVAAVECPLMSDQGVLCRPESLKSLGAYYTDSQVAEFLVWWSIRGATDTVLDPSFGGGAFLRAACKRLIDVGGNPAAQVFGVEVDGPVHGRISDELHDEFGVPPGNLLRSDFFAIHADSVRLVDVVVGNPPFIRYQRFAGEMRRRALLRAAEQGLKLSELSSSWLPFLVHSLRLLRPGGRLAMVIPFEIGHAAYAQPVLRHLSRTFEGVTFLTFRKKLFPNLSEDTLLLLGEGKRVGGNGELYIRDLADAGGLAQLQALDRRPLGGVRRLDREAVTGGRQRIIEYILPRKARELYVELRQKRHTVRLGDLADVGIGYVTGANDFFHFGPGAIAEWGIPSRFLRACVRRGRALAGLRFTASDWQGALARGDAGYLLELPDARNLPPSIARYLSDGERRGVHKTFKCRTRAPWYRVPHVYMPDGFLTYMSGDVPRLVANDARVVAPNTLHILRLHPDCCVTSDGVAALWQTSLARLSVEIEGHALGGGMLKLEPGEAGRVVLPSVTRSDTLEALATELDQIARSRGDEACSHHADHYLLRRAFGLSAAEVRLLRESALLLRRRRMSRSVLDERH